MVRLVARDAVPLRCSTSRASSRTWPSASAIRHTRCRHGIDPDGPAARGPRGAAWAGRCRSSRSRSWSMRWPGRISRPAASCWGSWTQLVNQQYLTSQGIYSIAIGVSGPMSSTSCCSACCVTHRPGAVVPRSRVERRGTLRRRSAKVACSARRCSACCRALRVGNAVTVGSLTIPAMIRVGYQREFAAGSRPRRRPAGRSPRRCSGRGVPDDRVPRRCLTRRSSRRRWCRRSCISSACSCRCTSRPRPGAARSHRRGDARLRRSRWRRWPTLIPLFLLLGIIVSGHTPYMAAFSGITSCAIVGLARRRRRRCPYRGWCVIRAHAVLARLRRHRSARLRLACSPRALPATPAVAARARNQGASAPALSSLRDRRQVRAGGRRRRSHRGHRDRRGHADRRGLQAVEHHHRRRAGRGRRCVGSAGRLVDVRRSRSSPRS